jgi:hypothetical protein
MRQEASANRRSVVPGPPVEAPAPHIVPLDFAEPSVDRLSAADNLAVSQRREVTGRWLSGLLFDFPVTKARHEMVVYQPGRLH